jgi:tRNA(Ile)-lysidine synthase
MPEPQILDRFRSELEKLTGRAPSDGAKLGIAVSGGPDSVALLLLAHQAYPGCIVAATVDHQLRTAAAEEALFVGELCKTRQIPHDTLRPAQKITGNLQSAARTVRYALLEEWRERTSANWVATAHHADDQLETLLMRMLRGTGVDGLAAIRPVNGRIVRPLLLFRKQELEAFLASLGVIAIQDPSNDDVGFDRVRMRNALSDFVPIEADRIGQTAEAMRQSSEALQWVVEQEARSAISEDANRILLKPDDRPAEIIRRLFLTCLNRLEPGAQPRGRALDRVIMDVSAGKKAMIGKIVIAPAPDGHWQFSVAPARKSG